MGKGQLYPRDVEAQPLLRAKNVEVDKGRVVMLDVGRGLILSIMSIDHISASLAKTHGSEKWDGETQYDEYVPCCPTRHAALHDHREKGRKSIAVCRAKVTHVQPLPVINCFFLLSFIQFTGRLCQVLHTIRDAPVRTRVCVADGMRHRVHELLATKGSAFWAQLCQCIECIYSSFTC